MKGATYKRGKTWSLVYDQARAEGGKRRQKWVSGFTTKKAAEEALAGLLSGIADGSYTEPRRLTFRELAEDQWIPAVRGRLRSTTLEAYERALKRHVYPVVGGVQIRRLDPGHLDRLYRSLSEEKKLGDGTVRFIHAIVSSCLKWARKKRLVAINVATLADLPATTTGRARKRVWTPDEVKAFLDHTADERLAALWRVLALTGCRRGEALALTWFAIDLDAGTARIERQLVPLAGRLEFVPPKSAAGNRALALDPGTVAILEVHRAAQAVEKAKWGEAYEDGGLVFAREDGTPLDPRGISQAFQVRRKASGLPTLNLHGLRHTAATHFALTVGAHRETVRAALGHASTRTTEMYYTHSLDGASRTAADALAGVYDGQV